MRAAWPPVMVLGVARSGTTLLKEMLDHHSELAIPGESYFLPALCRSFVRLWSREAQLERYFELLRGAALRKFGGVPWEAAQAGLAG